MRGDLEGDLNLNETCDEWGFERETFDVGILFGGGLAVNAGIADVLLDVAYDVGMRNLDKEPGTSDTMKGRTLCVSLGFLVPLQGRGNEF